MTDLLIRIAEELKSSLAFLGRALLPAWLLPVRDRDSHGGSGWAKRADGRRLGRLTSPEKPAGDGIVLGWLGRRLLQSPAEDNVLILGVQRSGKTSTVAVPTLLTWQGPVVATSTKEELVRLTSAARRRRGPIWVFAPLDRDQSWMEPLGLQAATWNPVDEALDCGAAAELADYFTAEGKRGPSTHWYLSAANLLTGLLAFAREREGDMRTVLITLNRTAQAEYLQLAGVVADQTAADLLHAFSMTPDREAGSIASTARSCLSLWIDERVALATSSGGNQIDLDQLLADAGTLYLVAPAEEAERCRPLFSALIASLLRRATTRARGQGGALSPRLLVALDEAANFARIPRLAGYASSGPGQGIQLLLCYHDLAQIEGAYGFEEARTIWNNCRARLLLPGQGDLKTLEHFSRAIGDETRFYDSAHHSRRETSSSEQRTGRPLITVDELRRLDQAVLLYANVPPARLSLRRWDQVPAWRALVQSFPPGPAAPVFPPAGAAPPLIRRKAKELR
ncbi:MAG TPA: type IV secretory system conjugative DNA transfer family protein [Candidatus Dormibacteraeota bacterium]|nr:type IV secretory system conjugative DNA transfer family protein [Candidatus Dormibacteraeota bacterium]